MGRYNHTGLVLKSKYCKFYLYRHWLVTSVILIPGGDTHILMGTYVPPYVKMNGAYGADQTEKLGAFRAERTVKVVPLELIELGKMGAFRKKRVLFELIELKK